MTRLQNLTAQINDVLDGGRPTPDGDIGHVASAYAQLSAQANTRLRRCLDLLRQGLRSEAVQEAQTEPELFALVQSLDLRRLQEWDRLCAENGLERPRPLLLEGIRALNDAFAEERRLEPLLRRHRAAALSRAPLNVRIEILRRLHESDAKNPIWKQDLEAFEPVRMRELEAMLKDEKRPRDLEWCNRLFGELVDARWIVKPPAALVKRTREVLIEAQRHWALTELRKLAPQLHEAHGALDRAACERLVGRANEVMQAAGMDEGDLPEDVRAAFSPAAAWLAGQLQQQANQQQSLAVADQLRRAMDREAPAEDLERLHDSLRQFDLPIDPQLETDYQRTMTGLRLAQRRRVRVRLSLIAAAVLLVTALVATATHDLLAERAAERGLHEADALLQAGNLPAAADVREGVAGWQPLLLRREAWRQALADLDGRLREGQEREAELASLLQRFEAAGPANTTQDMLRQAASLARSESETRRVSEARAAYERHHREMLDQRDAELTARAKELGEALAALNAAEADDPRTTHAALSRIETEIAAIRSAAEGRVRVRAALLPVEAEAQALRASVDQRVATAERQASEASALELISRQGFSAAALTGELERFIERFPDSPYAADFAAAVELRPSWEAAEAWATLVSGWEGELRPTTAADAARRVRAIQQYLQAHPNAPVRPQVEAYRNYLSTAVLIAAEDGPWRSRVSELMGVPVMAELNMVELPNGTRFYTVGDGRYRETVIGQHVDVALTTDLTKLTEVTFSPGTIKRPAPSPQRALAREVMQMTRTAEAGDGEVSALRQAQAIAQAQDVDPILRGLLLMQLAEAAPKTSESLGQRLAKWVEPLRGFDLEQANWLNGQDEAARSLRAEVQAALKQMPAGDADIDEVLRRDAAIRDAARLAVAGRGVLLERSGQRLVEGLQPMSDPVTLLAVARDPAGAGTRLTRIGAADADGVRLDERIARLLPMGSLVLAVR